MPDISIFFLALLFLVAFLYSAVGHGGASGYLALMALFNVAPEVMKPTALVLNIFVSLIAFYHFYKAKHFLWNIFLPLAITSVPCAFVGGMITVEQSLYKQILGVVLLFAIARLVTIKKSHFEENKESSISIALFAGVVIGLLSGMIGIGGGIILTPVLILLRWTNLKQASGISALFIFVNSIAGFAGQLYKGVSVSNYMVLFILVALSGGILGAYFGAKRFDQMLLKKVLAGVLLIAVIKLLTV